MSDGRKVPESAQETGKDTTASAWVDIAADIMLKSSPAKAVQNTANAFRSFGNEVTPALKDFGNLILDGAKNTADHTDRKS
ncbi:MAG: hypothetical protein K2X27_22280, partial [Candidatus Obscuribacterales bacterium]|nr:hypothetical protein [Candidatus Obscuribacterales bacterium]